MMYSMTQDIIQKGRRLVTLCLFLSAFLPLLYAGDQPTQPLGDVKNLGYTEDHPLIIVGDWDFRPFEYLNGEGQPAGYNVEVLDLILDELGIPHKFVMEEWHVATEIFKRRDADLIHALYFFFKDKPYVATRKYINYYNLKVARRIDTQPLHRLADIQPSDTLLLKEEDYAALAIADMGPLPFATAFHSPKDGLVSIRHGSQKYLIWGEIPLNHKIQELSLDSITLDEIDIPAGELRIIGYNKELIDLIDDQYTRLEQAGMLHNIYDRWFHPEHEHDNTSPVALFIIAGLLLTAFIVFLLIRLVRRRVSMTVRESSDLGKMMDRVLNMGDYFVVEWDFKSNLLRNKYGKMLPQDEMKPEEFLQRIQPEDGQRLHLLNAQLTTGVINHFDINIRFNRGTVEEPEWRDYYGNALVERDGSNGQQSSGHPLYIVYTTKDITEELNEELRVRTMAGKYKKMFDTNLVAMSFYDANGTLIDFNTKMRELCRIDEGNEQYFRTLPLFNFPNLKGVYLPGSRDEIYVCQHLDDPQIGLNCYIEFSINPVMNDDDELVYYIVTTRDITDERNMYVEQREHDRQLKTVNEDIKLYDQRLSYLLTESKMYIWKYRLADNAINMSRTTGRTEYTETMEEYIETIAPHAREEAMTMIKHVMQEGKPYTTVLPFTHTLFDDGPCWYSISGIPIFKDGQLTEYFGLARNITDLLEAQEKLRKETARAEDSGRQKAAFLANMTHEIRTPLNSIVGFSDILPTIEDAEEKKQLIRIIHDNCDMLLRLISDILEASDIDLRPMEISPTDIDFAKAFDDICQSLEQRMQNRDVQFIKDNPYTTFHTRLDKGRVRQVITNFFTNAVKYTQQGHIKVGYKASQRESDHADGLLIYCEDTGAGIAKEDQAHIFDRFVKLNEFVQGTGLGLNICKSIAERCGGNIGVDSDGKGKGSTFWIWIPCQV